MASPTHNKQSDRIKKIMTIITITIIITDNNYTPNHSKLASLFSKIFLKQKPQDFYLRLDVISLYWQH